MLILGQGRPAGTTAVQDEGSSHGHPLLPGGRCKGSVGVSARLFISLGLGLNNQMTRIKS